MDRLIAFLNCGSPFPLRHLAKTLAIGIVAATSLVASAAPPLSSLSCAQSTFIGSGTNACTVYLAWRASRNTYVSLQSNSAGIAVPGTVVVSRGATSASFTAVMNNVSTPQIGTITATLGGVSRAFNIALSPLQSSSLQLSASSINFGDVTVGATASRSLTVTAVGTVPIYVTSGSISGTGFSVSGVTPPATLNPGQSVVVSVQFNPATTGSVAGQISIVSSNAPTVALALSGNGIPVPPTVSGFSCAQNTFTGAASTACTVSLSSAAPAGGQTVALASSISAVTVPASINIPAGSSSAPFTANVASVATAQSGTITASANSSSKSVGIQLNPSTPALTLTSNSLAFGNVSLGTAVSKSITITSTGTAPVTITSDAISGTGFSVTGLSVPATLNPGQAAVVSVQFSPTSATSVTGQLTILSNAPPATVTLSGTGAAATPTISSLTCTTLSVAGALSDPCTVTLTGSAPTGGVAVSLASSSSAVAVPASITVPATATTASFTATISSVSTAQAATLSATTGSTAKTLALQLNAATSALSVNASSISFGAVTINTATNQSITLTSTGTAAVTVNSLVVSGSGFTVSPVGLPATLSPGQSMSVTLTFDPQSSGSFTGQLTIASNSAANPTMTLGLSGTGNPHQVELSWNAPSSSSNSIVGYNVYRAPSGTTSFGRVNANTDSGTVFTDSSVLSGTAYDYVVTSLDSTGAESIHSNTATVRIP